MTDQFKGRSSRDDSLVPLLTALVVLAAAGPALFTALTQWLLPRLSAGRDAVSLSLDEWWGRNWWLVLFWLLELTVLFAFLGWSRRRRARRSRQMDSVVTGLARVLPSDWKPDHDLRVLRWDGHRPVRLRLQLTPGSALDDPSWRRSVADAARKVLGPLEPIAWPPPPGDGVFDWGVRPPRVELRTAARSPERVRRKPPVPAEVESHRTGLRIEPDSARIGISPSGYGQEDVPIYRRPSPTQPAIAELGSASTRHDRED